MITVHHLENSRSQRVLWLLEELGASYEVKLYRRGRNMLAPPELRAVHPLGKSPVITDSGADGGGLRTIAETGAIFDYLFGLYDPGHLMPPPLSDERLDYSYYMYAAEGTFMTPLLLRLIAVNIRRRTPWPIKPVAWSIAASLENMLIKGALKANFDLWEAALTKSPWFAGDHFTAADIMMSFPVEAASATTDVLKRPRIKAWLDAIHARAAYKAALQRGGPYAYA